MANFKITPAAQVTDDFLGTVSCESDSCKLKTGEEFGVEYDGCGNTSIVLPKDFNTWSASEKEQRLRAAMLMSSLIGLTVLPAAIAQAGVTTFVGLSSEGITSCTINGEEMEVDPEMQELFTMPFPD